MEGKGSFLQLAVVRSLACAAATLRSAADKGETADPQFRRAARAYQATPITRHLGRFIPGYGKALHFPSIGETLERIVLKPE